jgi:multimeric flavodoxin WrbA
MANIIILNAASRKNGNTAGLVKAFMDGAKESGNEVKEFYLQSMTIRGCMACMGCTRNADPCAQKDEMMQIYDAFKTADVVVFSSPVYFYGVAGPLKTATDRLFAMFSKYGFEACQRDCALLMTSDDPQYDQAVDWYRAFTDSVGWNNLGEVLGSGGQQMAHDLGASIN